MRGALRFALRRYFAPQSIARLAAKCARVILTDVILDLDRARRERNPIAPPHQLAGTSLADAYAMQDRLVTIREDAGELRTGWKLGLTSAIKQRIMGITTPVYGRTFANGAFETDADVEHAAFVAPRCEPEIAFELAGPLDPTGDRNALFATIRRLAPALEITDSRYAGGTRTAIELIVDNTSAAGYVIGHWLEANAALPIAAMATEFLHNDAVIATGSSGDVLGDPVAALALLARHLAERGLATRAGDIVLSGAITDAAPARPGDRFEARIAGLGAVRVAFR